MRLLDLFCGAGGAAVGYHRAGFTEVLGVDLEPQPDYPYPFRQGDALGALAELDPAEFDLVHASPPCQAYTTMNNRRGAASARWPGLIDDTRDALELFGRPYVIENVPGAVGELHDPVELTGEMFGLPVHRARLFELGGWFTLVPAKPRRQPDPAAVYGKPDGRRLWTRADGTEHRAWSSLEAGRAALGVDWMTDAVQVAEAIPPAYTEYLGAAFLAQRCF